MVLMGHRGKSKQKPIKEALACASSKMAAKARALAELSASSPARSDVPDSEEETDIQENLGGSPSIPHTGMLQTAFMKLMETMLHKALKATSDQITNSLTREIREIGQRTADL